MQTKLWQRPNVCNKVYNGAVQELLGGWVVGWHEWVVSGWLRVSITFCGSFYGFVLGGVCVCGFLAYLHVKVVESAAVFGCCARISRLSDNFHFFPYILPIPECQLQTFKVFLAFSFGPTNDKLCQWVCVCAVIFIFFWPWHAVSAHSLEMFCIFLLNSGMKGKCNCVIYFHHHLLPDIIYVLFNIKCTLCIMSLCGSGSNVAFIDSFKC